MLLKDNDMYLPLTRGIIFITSFVWLVGWLVLFFVVVVLFCFVVCFWVFCLFVCFLVFRDRVSLCNPGCPGTHTVDQDGLELRNPPASASEVLGLKVCAISSNPHKPCKSAA